MEDSISTMTSQAEPEAQGPDGIGADWGNAPVDGRGPDTPAADEAETGGAPDGGDEESAWPEDASSLETDGDGDMPGDGREADQSFTLKHLGEVRTVGRDEMIALAQKGLDYDRQRQKNDDLTAKNSTLTAEAAAQTETLALLNDLAATQGMTVEQLADAARVELLARSEGIPVAAAAERIRAQRAAGLSPAARPKTPEEAAAEKRHTDIREFLAEYRDIDPEAIPREVWQAVADGKPLLTAYQSWELNKLRAEKRAAAKNTENREKTAGSRQSTGAALQRDPITADWYS
ncbi:hypothetical protein SAMN02745823_02540 [Sporobacter termitidis DSM 10068]|uniref:Uncharacterized protein n=1 Tax=Sporobacter termitidis DSM 10068 TaxID=1123282 RepID=A0A1M5YHP0_9FIRM|nr:hypothetical protein [Sporobacter termitidis]SHI11444.1 hypothetical protein SAMN02745823_02540 [Sporobacter termitidis DSM 10068]